MTVLEILGQDWSRDYLWISLDGSDEFEVTPNDLAIARRSVQRGYSARLRGHWLDESQITDLIKAMDAPQPYWPPVLCEDGDCGAEAVTNIEGRKVCHGHAAGYTAREEGL
jgi:hypothetical protein